jgi:hypothetical protein
VRSHIGIRLDFADQFYRAAGHIVVGNFAGDQFAGWADNESTSQSQTGFFVINAKHSRHFAGRVRGHGEFDTVQEFFGLLPGRLDIFSVGGNRDYLSTKFLQNFLILSEFFEFRGADGSICRREEEQNGPFAGFFELTQGNLRKSRLSRRPCIHLKTGNAITHSDRAAATAAHFFINIVIFAHN